MRTSSSTRVIRAPAKVNLFFEVLSRRDDGFYEIVTLMCPINLYDTLRFTPAQNGEIDFACRWAPGLDVRALGEVPDDQSNLVVRTLQLVRRRASINTGAVVRLCKRIPADAGLGGGSSDAAAAIVAADHAWNLNWSPEQLADVAAEIGSDVPFFLAGGAAVCRGRGERVEATGPLGRIDLVVIRPPVGLATAEVFGHCRPADVPRSPAPLIEALRSGDSRGVDRGMYNALETAAENCSPWIGRLRRELAALDVKGFQMSGSGTSFFAICRHGRHARRVAAQLFSRGLGQVFVARNLQRDAVAA